MKDWTGNSRSAHATLGARNYALEERETEISRNTPNLMRLHTLGLYGKKVTPKHLLSNGSTDPQG